MASNDELFRLASLVGCEPEDEERHRKNLSAYILAQVKELVGEDRPYIDGNLTYDSLILESSAREHLRAEIIKAAQARFGAEKGTQDAPIS